LVGEIGRQGLRLFVVDAENLVRLALFDMGEEAFLERRGASGIGQEHTAVDARLVQQSPDRRAFVVVADDASQQHIGVESPQQCGHGPCAAQSDLARLGTHHQDRRLGAHAIRVPPRVPVQHDIAHHEHAACRTQVKRFFRSGHDRSSLGIPASIVH
jgi:hypothetical protein